MTVTLSLTSDVEKGLLARAQSRGVSLSDYLQELVAREAGVLDATNKSGKEKAAAFVQWAKSHRYTPPLSDEAISRASMYPDRG